MCNQKQNWKHSSSLFLSHSRLLVSFSISQIENLLKDLRCTSRRRNFFISLRDKRDAGKVGNGRKFIFFLLQKFEKRNTKNVLHSNLYLHLTLCSVKTFLSCWYFFIGSAAHIRIKKEHILLTFSNINFSFHFSFYQAFDVDCSFL